MLIVDDNADDTALLLRELSHGGYEPHHRRVETVQQMYEALDEKHYDIILAAYAVLELSGPEEFKVIHDRITDTPIIVVSGKVGEEVTVDLLRSGARDFVVKSNLGRLNTVVESELREAELRREKRQVDEALKKSEEDYRQLVENINDIVYSVNLEGIITYVSPAVQRIFGKDRKNYIGRPLRDFIHPEDLSKVLEKFSKTLDNILEPEEFRVMIRPGIIRWIRINGRPMIKDGKVIGVQGVLVDITERKRAEEELKALNDRYLELFNSVVEGITFVDENEILRMCNLAYAKIYDYESPSEMIGKSVLDFLDEGQAEVVRYQSGIRRENKSSTYDLDIITAKANRKTISISAAPKYDQAGNFIGSFGTIVDITERKKAERALKESEEKYRTLVEMFPNAITIFQDGKTVFANQASINFFGAKDMNAIIGHDFLEPVPEHDRARVKEYMDRCMAGDHAVPNSSQIDLLRADGSTIPVEVYGNRIIYNGRPACQVMAIDITERRKAEQALRESEEKYRTLVEMFPHAIAIFQDHNTVFVNQSAVKFFGVKEIGEILNHHSIEPVPAHEREGLSQYMARRMAGDPSVPESYNVELMRADGKLFPTEIYANRIIYDGKPASQVLAIDITERRKAEQDIKKSEERYRTIVETASEGIWMIDAEAKTTFVNKQMAEMLGYTVEDIMGKPLFSFMDNSGIKMTTKALKHRRQGIKETYENKFIHKNGTAIDVNISAAPLFDANNRYAGALAMITEITERKKHEFRAAARSSLLYDLHSAATITDCLQMGCQTILKAGLYKRALFILNDIENTADIAHIGFRKFEILAIGNAAPLEENMIGKLMDEKYRISRSYFIPYHACGTAKGTWLHLILETKVDSRQMTASKDSSLIVPVLGGNGANKGCLLIAVPDGKPDANIVKFIEEIVEIVLTRVREVRNEIQIAGNNRRLEEKNLALKEVMGMIETEKEEIRQQTARMIDQTIKPILNRLVRRNGMVNRPHYELLKTALEELALATGGTMQIAARLSPRELEICSLIKGGSSSKDIAETLDISLLTVQKHREVIRRKLGLTNLNINLTTHLRNL